MHKDGANIVMEVEQQERARLPVHMLEGLVCFGRVLVSPPLMGYCAEQGHMHPFFTLMVDFWLASKGPSPAMCYCVVNNIGSVTIRALCGHCAKSPLGKAA